MSDNEHAASETRASSVKTAADVAAPNSKNNETLSVPQYPTTELKGGEGESAIPEDKKVYSQRQDDWRAYSQPIQEEALENEEDDWAHDPANPRNWSFKKKWTMTGIVRAHHVSTTISISQHLLCMARSHCTHSSLPSPVP